MEQSFLQNLHTMSFSYLASTIKKSLRDFQFLKKTEIVAPKPIGFLCSFIPLLGGKVSLQPDIFKRQASCCYTQNTFAAENLLREPSRQFSTITMPAGKKTSRKRKCLNDDELIIPNK
ncbi:hypothetical protein HID58_085246 [Brassica napus]|uniref:Uncharacterized protein n=2 Tax=Brassica TaxID=3705 RepID=A0ABQ7XM25_BRANA|nr:hypothetical protein HID58_085246 [Brassica napus]